MPTIPTIEILLKQELNKETRAKLVNTLEALNPAGVVSALIRAGNKHSLEIMGYFLMPLLNQRIQSDQILFDRLLKGVASKNSGKNYQMAVLDTLDKIACLKGGDWQKRYQTGLIAIVVNPNVAVQSRAKALRQLARIPQPEVYAAVKAAIDSKEPVLVNAAGSVLYTWLRKKQDVPPDITSGLFGFCQQNPAAALQQPGVLRALASHSSSEAQTILETLHQQIEKPEQRDAMLSALGALASINLLGSLLKGVFFQPTDAGIQAVKGIFAQKPQKLGELYKAGYSTEYLTCLQLVPNAARFTDLSNFRAMLNDSDIEKAKLARSLYLEQIDVLPSVKEIIEGQHNILPDDASSHPTVIGNGFATGLQKGDAIYKSLGNGSSSGSSGTDIFGNHWHAGLFTGFQPSYCTGAFVLGGVQVNSWSYCVQSFSVSDVLTSRTLSLTAVMQGLKDKFTAEFGCTGSVPFHGARSAPSVDYFTRQKIINTAWAMIGKNIEWTFVDQLDYYWWDWDGTIDDIDELRCDGLVEYSYEANGVRVCGGIDDSKWNVSYPDADYAENHNNFHGYGCSQEDYENGDLCPRIQAGNIANDTTFIPLPAAIPDISKLEIYAPSPCCVWFYFEVEADLSKYIYIRLLVRKAGEMDFYFVKTEDPLEMGEANGGCLEGSWCLKQVDIRRSHNSVGAFWMGKTTRVPQIEMDLFGYHYVLQPETPGPHFQNVPGKYEFRLQCIDEGGNVSDEWSHQLDVTWK